MQDRKAYIDKLTAQLKEWDREIDKLEEKAQKAKEETKVRYKQEIKDLRARQDQIRNQLQQLRRAGEEAWRELKSGAEKSWKEMTTALKNARAKL